jgi:hypothetical protein
VIQELVASQPVNIREEKLMSCYTNAVLTVIAVALIALVFENGLPLARAQSGLPPIMRVIICDPHNQTTCAAVGPASYGNQSYSVLTRTEK